MTNKVKELVERLDDQLERRWGEIYYNFEGKGFLNVPVELIESCKSELERLEAENTWQPIEKLPKNYNKAIVGYIPNNTGIHRYYVASNSRAFIGKEVTLFKFLTNAHYSDCKVNGYDTFCGIKYATDEECNCKGLTLLKQPPKEV